VSGAREESERQVAGSVFPERVYHFLKHHIHNNQHSKFNSLVLADSAKNKSIKLRAKGW